MPLSKKMLNSLNDQLTMELAASHQYLAMAGWFEAQNLPGMAGWMRSQSDEERAHAVKFFDFVLDSSEDVTIGPLEAPHSVFASPLEAFEAALASEKRVTAAISELYALTNAEGEYTSIPLLTWFLNEQVEEEAMVEQIVEDLRRAGDDAQALLLLDRELGGRAGAGP